MNEFLKKHGYTIQEPLQQDASSRSYYRVEKNNHTAILMDCGAAPSRGHSLTDFVRIGTWLHDSGLSVPDIYEIDKDNGLAILEDFGETRFKDKIKDTDNPLEFYQLAHNVLSHLAQQDCQLDLPNYFDSHVHKGHRRIIHWYLPTITGHASNDNIMQAYLDIWQQIENEIPACPQGFMHIDYHVENLMWLEGRNGIKKCGILDFQGAMIGPRPYDLGNLLEDARWSVPPSVRELILEQYPKDYQLWYRILTTQFHCRVLGQFIKLAVEQGKDHYLSYLPHIEHYLSNALDHPMLTPLKSFFNDLNIDFRLKKPVDTEKIRHIVPAENF